MIENLPYYQHLTCTPSRVFWRALYPYYRLQEDGFQSWAAGQTAWMDASKKHVVTAIRNPQLTSPNEVLRL